MQKPWAAIRRPQLTLVPQRASLYGLYTAKQIGFCFVHFGREVFGLFSRVEHNLVIDSPRSQLFKFPNGIRHRSAFRL
jgi:hypothetical protein